MEIFSLDAFGNTHLFLNYTPYSLTSVTSIPA